jgi:cytochrome oxidase assembly protein ShyY1
MGWKEWFRPPRHLLLMFLGITFVSASALGWLSWQLVRQDRALAVQRAQEQRENAASLAVAALQKHLSQLDDGIISLAAVETAELGSIVV